MLNRSSRTFVTLLCQSKNCFQFLPFSAEWGTSKDLCSWSSRTSILILLPKRLCFSVCGLHIAVCHLLIRFGEGHFAGLQAWMAGHRSDWNKIAVFLLIFHSKRLQRFAACLVSKFYPTIYFNTPCIVARSACILAAALGWCVNLTTSSRDFHMPFVTLRQPGLK